jgi:hydrogenase maturation protease
LNIIKGINLKRVTEEQVNREGNQLVTVAVLGLGNPVLGDDGVGLHVAAEVERLLLEGPVAGVTVLTSTRAGFDLINLLSGFTHAIIIDCLDIPQPVPGRIRLLDLNSLSGSARLVGVHDISVADAFELAATLGTGMPGSVEIYAVEGEDTQTISEEMTHAVSSAVAPLARMVYARAEEWARNEHSILPNSRIDQKPFQT